MSKLEDLKNKMRQRGSTPAGSVTANTPSLQKVAAFITHTCNHHSALDPNDKYLKEKLEKEQKRLCPRCRKEKADEAARLAAEKEAAKIKAQEEQAKKPKKPKPVMFPADTGVGFRFEFDHIGIANWTARLVRLSDDKLINTLGGFTSVRRAWSYLSEEAKRFETKEKENGKVETSLETDSEIATDNRA